jgi:DHA1 family bicyclomycin/chloramphenicol resistance-like MFS transporter
VGTLLTKKLANKIGWDKLIFIAIFFSLANALSMLIFNLIWTHHLFLVILPMMCIMIGVGIIIPCTQAAVMQPFPTMTGTASGLFFFIQMSFGAICGLVIQLVEGKTHFSMIIIIFISSILLCASFYWLIWKPSNRKSNDR